MNETPPTEIPDNSPASPQSSDQKSETTKRESAEGVGWEREVLNRLAFASLNEQKRARRWSIFFRSLAFAYLFLLLYLFYPGADTGRPASDKYTGLVDLQGTITDVGDASADNIISGLRAAFEDEGTVGVVLRINSPGGSPVQAGYVYDEIRRLREEYPNKPLYAVVTDMCASGGYYIAAAADGIYANRASIVGSIGVVMNGFGFVDTMQKLGVERRLYTAGDHKGFLDPFSAEQPDEVAHLKKMLTTIHAQFIKAVKDGRGNRLKEDPRLFSGLVWTGEEAVDMGLVDGLGSASFVAREVIGAEELVDFTAKPAYLEKFVERIGLATAQGLTSSLRTGALQ